VCEPGITLSAIITDNEEGGKKTVFGEGLKLFKELSF
jgi:hypothetical protein